MTTVFLFLTGLSVAVGANQEVIDLAGRWSFQTDVTDFERAFDNTGAQRDPLADTVLLPGTTDTNRKGIKTTGRPVNRLSRHFEYVGPAWYQKDVTIPPTWQGRSVELFLERALWITSLYVDGALVGNFKSFSTPHRYDLTALLTPGKHLLSICVDNRVPDSFGKWSHAFSEYTQTDWNGIVGKLELRSRPALNIKDLQVYPNVKTRTAEVVCVVNNPDGAEITGSLEIVAVATNTAVPHTVQPTSVSFHGSGRALRVTATVPMGPEVQLWDEFHPTLYDLTATLSGTSSGGVASKDTKSVEFGMRQYGQLGAQFAINGRPVFLRGTLECAIFPLTGYPDMGVEGWLRICRIVKSYGLNHLRFHSWCPPEAAFAAADQLGVYLQVELPCWTEIGKDPDLDAFLRAEMDRILAAYGNHPSFVQLCMGNELQGDFDVLAEWVQHGKDTDPRHLYSASTARKHVPEDEFYVSHQSSAGGMTTYGARGPQTDYDLREAYGALKVPGVAHEVGQRAVYPNFDEMKKYTGVLTPRNFEVFQQTLAEKGMRDQAQEFFKVSGKMTSFLYKESIEALLRTPNCGGFQLLDLHDFPGQGTALVGILDPFWDSKGMITPKKFREFCGPTVPLLRLPKRTYSNNETLKAAAQLYHYGEKPLVGLNASWEIRAEGGVRMASGKFETREVGVGGLTALGEISVELSGVARPQKLMITVHAGPGVENSWEVWVYPAQLPATPVAGLVVAKTLAEATSALDAGKSVLLTPDLSTIEGKKAEFQNHFWCPIMFRWEPMTMGTLVRDKHPALRDFPTEFYTNWQWWDLVSNARLLVLDGASPTLKPIVQPIDTYDRCLRLGLILEAKVGEGRLLLASIDLERDLANRPAARQLLHSLKRYAASVEFKPTAVLQPKQLAAWFKEPTLMTGARVVMTDSYQAANGPENAIDGDPGTIWHTSYDNPGESFSAGGQPEPGYPHELQIELAKDTVFKGFSCLPRSDGVNGNISRFEFSTSDDGKSWGSPVAQGFFSRDAKEKIVLFNKPVKARYIRLVALEGFNGQKWASLAELKLIPPDELLAPLAKHR